MLLTRPFLPVEEAVGPILQCSFSIQWKENLAFARIRAATETLLLFAIKHNMKSHEENELLLRTLDEVKIQNLSGGSAPCRCYEGSMKKAFAQIPASFHLL